MLIISVCIYIFLFNTSYSILSKHPIINTRRVEDKDKKKIMEYDQKYISNILSTSPKEVSVSKGDIFWFYNASQDRSNLGYNKEFFTYIKKITLPILEEKLPLMVEKKLAKPIYSSIDYPRFSPKIFFSSNVSLGEKERIKKSLILIKIILNSDAFIYHTYFFKNLNSISSFYPHIMKDLYREEKIYKNEDSLLNLEFYLDNIPKSSIRHMYNYIVNTKNTIYIKKSTMNTYKQDGSSVIAAAVGNINVSDSSIEDIIDYRDNNNSIITFYNDGKSMNSFSNFMPILIFHEYIHTLGYPHKMSKEDPDMVLIFSSYIFHLIYLNTSIPKIPRECYNGDSEVWGNC